ncbi:hypothetical protein PGTUg99_011279 [Puccinia graminis f. sp. tritici]|uniref:Uncharacterized protein n=1 Tax=Puccinia graminis f. sp. tritici TaxID=56615 RepID=A0A5B0QQX1_PUCGR|nr:hypothetical protein PGTUg99_011279 [Puccinia graminis f. sp. tritici]
MYACPHLNTCGDVKYNKKACHSHSRLSATAVKRHTLNEKIHGNCGPDCPAYGLDARSVQNFQFQIFERGPHQSAICEGTETRCSLALETADRSWILRGIQITLRAMAYGI